MRAYALQYLDQSNRPGVERFSLFSVVGMTVIDGGHAGLDMVQDFGDNQSWRTHRRHERCRGAAEVVAAELDARSVANALDRFLGASELPVAARSRKYPWRVRVFELAQDIDRGIRQGHSVR